ncbi:hypothetical protein [Candidatus Nitrosotalea bavarica]|uniref:hypothetical protein n=1 Tax=Candidatus Nitrosotalea bavarica TaxID=1903277 RepID=UPI000C70EC6C|nr:hypothetical protein [Candidatus Nitrosotalea bavarica]
MSQILIPEFGKATSLLFQDLYFVVKKTPVKTTTQEATCIICQKGLEDGVSVTAKRIGMKLRLFCQYHIPE